MLVGAPPFPCTSEFSRNKKTSGKAHAQWRSYRCVERGRAGRHLSRHPSFCLSSYTSMYTSTHPLAKAHLLSISHLSVLPSAHPHPHPSIHPCFLLFIHASSTPSFQFQAHISKHLHKRRNKKNTFKGRNQPYSHVYWS